MRQKKFCYGISSLVSSKAERFEDSLHVVLLDFDTAWCPYRTLHEVQAEYDLETFYVFRTKHGYHVYCPSVTDVETYKEILEKIGVCRDFLRFGEAQQGWILRVSPKFNEKGEMVSPAPEYHRAICRYSGSWAENFPLLVFLKAWFGLEPIEDCGAYKCANSIKIQWYITYKE